MKLKVLIGLIIFVFSGIEGFSQAAASSATPSRNRIVEAAPTLTSTPMPIVSPTPVVSPTATTLPKGVTVTSTMPTPKPFVKPAQIPSSVNLSVSPVTIPVAPPTFFKPLSFSQIKSKIAEARRHLSARPTQTALTDSFLVTDVVRIAFYDYNSSNVDYVLTTKSAFLARNAEIRTTTSNGKFVTIRVPRANYVNTPVLIIDSENRAHLPLIVQYPIEKKGAFTEMAYYISAHPGIVTPEVVNAGKLYIHNTFEVARENLQKKGIVIQPQVMDTAERLSIVEHVDHQRFWNEYHSNIYSEIYALYALNEKDTYRYSVSSAGAGGMVQMIPPTYSMIRSRYYSAGLIPDFVTGMRNHANAAQAMLLYMQMTWNDLIANETIAGAVAGGIATPAELMSAGYNSNPAKLAGYIRRGGANWKTLIPRETKVYLQIYASMDKYVPYLPRTK